jgi:hypothetical protein
MTDEKTRAFNLTLTQISAGAFAATTAAILGSTLGVAGTVVGAALGSVTTTIASAVYQHSLERSRERVLAARRRAFGGAAAPGRPAQERAEHPGLEQPTLDRLIVEQATGEQPVVAPPAFPRPGRDGERHSRRRLAVAGGTLAAFALSLLAITGLEALQGGQLSGGGGTTVGSVLDRAAEPAGDPDPTQAPPTEGVPQTPESFAPTSTPEPATTTSGTTGSTTPPTTSSTGSPTTTSDATSAPRSTPPASGP